VIWYTLLFSPYFLELKIEILEYKMSDAKIFSFNLHMKKKLKFQEEPQLWLWCLGGTFFICSQVLNHNAQEKNHLRFVAIKSSDVMRHRGG
jgi:hypothetical protein